MLTMEIQMSATFNPQEPLYPNNKIKTALRALILASTLTTLLYLQYRNFYAFFNNDNNRYIDCTPQGSTLARYCQRPATIDPWSESMVRFYVAMSCLYATTLLIAAHQILIHPISISQCCQDKSEDDQREVLLRGSFQDNHPFLFNLYRFLVLDYFACLYIYTIELERAKENALFECKQINQLPPAWACEKGGYDSPYTGMAFANFILTLSLGALMSLYGLYKLRSFGIDLKQSAKAKFALCFSRTDRDGEAVELNTRTRTGGYGTTTGNATFVDDNEALHA